MNDWTGNKHSIFTTLGASNHTEQERDSSDYYATDGVAIDKLLSVCPPPLPGTIWECACGRGDLSKRLIDNGYSVVSSDIADRGYGKAGVDFLSTLILPCKGITTILTNPPYKYALEFVLHALQLLSSTGQGQVYMFLKTTFLEGKKRKEQLFTPYPPKCIYQFSERVLCAKNAEFEKMKAGGGSAVAYAWYVWEIGHKGETIVKWI